MLKKASQRLNALKTDKKKRRMIIKIHFNLQFGYYPLEWTIHSRRMNKKNI